jgi:hypothetical protein
MPEYLLPCPCGRKTPVSTAQAGETIRCACGAEMQVPTLRGLRAMQVADASRGGRRAGVWEDRHRAAFALVLGSLACLGVAVYLWAILPPRPMTPSTKEVSDRLNEGPPAESLQIYAEMQQGLGQPPTADPNEKSRRVKTWGIGVALAIAASLAGAAWAVLRRPRRQRGTIKTHAGKPSGDNKGHRMRAP